GVQNVLAALEHGGHQRQKCAVEDQRAGVQNDALRRDAVGGGKAGAVGSADGVGVHNAFGQPGGAAAVDDVVRVFFVDGGVRWFGVGGNGRQRPVILVA